MRVLVAGATSVLGAPTLEELSEQGHETFGLTRHDGQAARITANRGEPVVADVADAQAITRAVAKIRPDVVVSLLITLPRFGPRRAGDYAPTVRLWRTGVPNLVAAAAAAGVRRFVAESVIFGYGYGRHSTPVDESRAFDISPTPHALRDVLSALHAMERLVIGHTAVGGTVLRHGLFHGRTVPTTQLLARLLRRRAPVVPGHGRGVLSWIELSDAARATAAAVDRAHAGEIYNVTDDRPVTFFDYASSLARTLDLPPPRRAPKPLARLAAPLAARIFDDMRLAVRNDKAKRDLAWDPRHPNPLAIGHELSAPQSG